MLRKRNTMPDENTVHASQVLAALLEAKAWFRHGLADEQICRQTGLSLAEVLAVRRGLAEDGLIERQGVGTERPVTMLTPKGVAQARAEAPAAVE
jgi:hypothetical protein